MEQVKFLPLLIICVQTAKGFIWISSTTSISVCVGNTISLDWVYTLASTETLQVTSWIKSDGAGGSLSLATDLVGFVPAQAYVGRLKKTVNASIEISNATSSDIGTYTVTVSLTSGDIYRKTATVHVHEIANASCKPTCDSSWKCQIPQACPVQNYIDAVWTVDGVKHPNAFQCSPNNYNKPYNVCAEGDAVTLCYSGPSLCLKENLCIDRTQWWCKCDWCIGLSVASGGLLVFSLVIGIIIFLKKQKDLENHMCWQISTITIAVVVMTIIVVTSVLAGIVCLCWKE